jgi:acetamidase/formamidase
MIVNAGPKTCHWGYFDADVPPVATIASGDEVTINTVSGAPHVLPGAGFHIPPELLEIHAMGAPAMPGHILTGPVAVDGAMPGDVLQIDILDVQLRQDWGYTFIRPLSGTLPLDFPEFQKMTIPLDAARAEATLPWGTRLPLAPFFGVMAVAPPRAWGRISTIEPRAHGGNLDNKELVAGTTLYLPVMTEGALFSCGDGHGAQGDGEVCVTAIETALQGRFRLTIRRDMDVTYPEAETPTHLITMGMHPDLDVCVEMALRRMITLISDRAGISRAEAYMLCSLAGDLRITQTVNKEKGVHMMFRKSLMTRVDQSE